MYKKEALDPPSPLSSRLYTQTMLLKAEGNFFFFLPWCKASSLVLSLMGKIKKNGDNSRQPRLLP